MKNCKEKNIKKIIVDFFVLFINFGIIFSYIVTKSINNLDEIWNFNTARQIMNGLIPYKQISMITTPLFPTINSIFLKIFGDEIFVFRILSAIGLTIILFLIYKIFEKLLQKRIVSIISIETILILYITHFYWDYNFFLLILLFVIELIDICYCDKDKKTNNIIIGIIAGLSICTKQTTGIFISFFVVMLPLINNRKNPIKQRIKLCFYRIIGICIPLTIFVLFLFFTKSLNSFINYAILGIKTFNNTISYKNLINNEYIYIKVLAIIIPITVICEVIFELIYICSKKIKNQEKLSRFNVLVLYSFPMLITVYPIADSVHFLIAILPICVVILYLFFKAILELYDKIKIEDKKYLGILLESAIMIIFGIILIKATIYNYIEYSKESKTKLNHYNNLNIDQGIEDTINELSEFYCKNKDKNNVILVDASAAIFNIPLDMYNKNYDMFLKGNIGKDGEDGIINDIENSSNTLYLIKKEGLSLNWQTPTKVIDYIRNNLEKQDEVGIFDVYYKK